MAGSSRTGKKAREVVLPAPSDLFECKATDEEMIGMLQLRGIQIPHYKYRFSILPGCHRLSDVRDYGKGFLLPLYVFATGFHLPLHPWFVTALKSFEIAPGQLTGSSWYLLTSFFIDCCRRKEKPRLSAFRNLYQLVFIEKLGQMGTCYFTQRSSVGSPIVGKQSNYHSDKKKFIYIEDLLGDGFPFSLDWKMPSSATCSFLPPLQNDLAQKQFNRYKSGSCFDIKKLVTLNNIWVYCLNQKSPNGVDPSDLLKVDVSKWPSPDNGWPFGGVDDVAKLLRGEVPEPENFVKDYTSSRLKKRGAKSSSGMLERLVNIDMGAVVEPSIQGVEEDEGMDDQFDDHTEVREPITDGRSVVPWMANQFVPLTHGEEGREDCSLIPGKRKATSPVPLSSRSDDIATVAREQLIMGDSGPPVMDDDLLSAALYKRQVDALKATSNSSHKRLRKESTGSKHTVVSSAPSPSKGIDIRETTVVPSPLDANLSSAAPVPPLRSLPSNPQDAGSEGKGKVIDGENSEYVPTEICPWRKELDPKGFPINPDTTMTMLQSLVNPEVYKRFFDCPASTVMRSGLTLVVEGIVALMAGGEHLEEALSHRKGFSDLLSSQNQEIEGLKKQVEGKDAQIEELKRLIGEKDAALSASFDVRATLLREKREMRVKLGVAESRLAAEVARLNSERTQWELERQQILAKAKEDLDRAVAEAVKKTSNEVVEKLGIVQDRAVASIQAMYGPLDLTCVNLSALKELPTSFPLLNPAGEAFESWRNSVIEHVRVELPHATPLPEVKIESGTSNPPSPSDAAAGVDPSML